MKEERIFKKIGKLLDLYGVDPEEKEKFLLDLKDKKYDDQEEVEETVEEEEPTEELGEELPSEEDAGGEEQVEEVSEDAEEPVDEPLPEEPVEDAEPVSEEQPTEELPTEQPAEQPIPQEQPQQQPTEDFAKTIEGLQARIDALEELVAKLGEPVDQDVGVAPTNPSGESYKESEMDRYNRMRMGR